MLFHWFSQAQRDSIYCVSCFALTKWCFESAGIHWNEMEEVYNDLKCHTTNETLKRLNGCDVNFWKATSSRKHLRISWNFSHHAVLSVGKVNGFQKGEILFHQNGKKTQSYLLSVETNNEDLKATQKSRINKKDKLEAFHNRQSGELCQHIILDIQWRQLEHLSTY